MIARVSRTISLPPLTSRGSNSNGIAATARTVAVVVVVDVAVVVDVGRG